MLDSNPFALEGVPTLLDCLRIELQAVLDRGRAPVKLLVNGDCIVSLIALARDEGELEEASPSRILGLPVMLGSSLVSRFEGARIVCDGDTTSEELLRRRASVQAGNPASPF
jgi:hypothetical protein